MTGGCDQREQVAHLGVQARVGERVGGELVAQEAADDVLGVGDGVQGHFLCCSTRRGRCRVPAAPLLYRGEVVALSPMSRSDGSRFVGSDGFSCSAT